MEQNSVPVGRLPHIYTVSRLNREVKSLLEDGFPALWVEGEVSNLARPASGHFYFCLKDASAQIRCALFKNQARVLPVAPKDGMHVLVRARVSLYEGRGEFQLIIEHVEDSGEGALRRAFEALKLRLAREGLFDSAHKKKMPSLAHRIGIVTSPTGAAIRDILITLRRRFPAIAILLYPVPVQGEGAAEKIATMIHLASDRNECDALIVARGGGSLEDLWPFNEEVVARAIFACRLPVITGVGHETDVTIADLVADLRTPTPTAAAEVLSPSQATWLAQFEHFDLRLLRLMERLLSESAQKLDWMNARLVRPDRRLALMQQRLRSLSKRLVIAQAAHFQRVVQVLATQRTHLRILAPSSRIKALRQRTAYDDQRLRAAFARNLSDRAGRLQNAVQRLHALDPLATLARGYAIVSRVSDNAVLRKAQDARAGELIRARIADGALICTVERIEDESKRD